jgi:uncharacterized protein YuzB (UPF0349 family)
MQFQKGVASGRKQAINDDTVDACSHTALDVLDRGRPNHCGSALPSQYALSIGDVSRPNFDWYA